MSSVWGWGWEVTSFIGIIPMLSVYNRMYGLLRSRQHIHCTHPSHSSSSLQSLHTPEYTLAASLHAYMCTCQDMVSNHCRCTPGSTFWHHSYHCCVPRVYFVCAPPPTHTDPCWWVAPHTHRQAHQ
jgi:hypothetical protein